MPLRLQVVSAHREAMGGSYLQEFAACGGSIGRSLECDWPLPDSKRYISSKHAMIDYQGGAYYLADLSRNGVYINGSDAPVGTGNPQRIFDGDSIRIGEFEIQVAIIDDPSEGDEDGMRDSVVRAQLVPEDESVETSMLSADKLSDNISLEAILTPGGEANELSGVNRIPANSDAVITARITADFLRAAGADPAEFNGMPPQDVLLRSAQMLSEFIEATHALLASKDRLSKQLNLKATDNGDATNPLRSAEGLASALRLLLGNSNTISSSGTEAIEGAFKELMRHQKAVISAMQTALADHEDSASGDKQKHPKQFGDDFARAYELETTE